MYRFLICISLYKYISLNNFDKSCVKHTSPIINYNDNDDDDDVSERICVLLYVYL